MHSVNAILLQLPNMNKLDAVRWAVVELIREQLHRRRDSLDEWEASHFANAITMLAMNVNALHQPTTAWLRLCLVDLQNALTPDGARPAAPVRDANSAPITFELLMEALDAIVRQLDRRDPRAPTPTSAFRRYLDRISNVGNLDFGAAKFSG